MAQNASLEIMLWSSLFLLFFALPARAAQSRPLCPDCNVVVVALDILRADELAVLGSTRAPMPNLDALARRGVLFANAYSQAPLTLPSDMSLFTGLYPWRHGVNIPFSDVLPERIPTLALQLKNSGYETLFFGPLRSDFRDINGGISIGSAKGIDRLEEDGPPDFSNAIDWLSRRPKSPFFAYLYSHHLHTPYLPRLESVLKLEPATDPQLVRKGDELAASVRAEVLADPLLIFRSEFVSAHPELFASGPMKWDKIRPFANNPVNVHTAYWGLLNARWLNSFPIDSATPERLRLLYDALAFELDQRVGALMRALASAGLADKTLVIFTSEHGEEFMEHGRTTHSQLYQECLHVPLIMIVPGVPARRVEQLVENVDVMPTILEAVGVPVPPDIDGTSLLPALRGRPLKEPRRARAYWRNHLSVRDSSFTYIAALGADGAPLYEELYDRVADPGERSNLLPARADAARSFRETMPRISSTVLNDLPPAELDEKMRQRIMRTGYW